jgi:hypothetical protein
MVRAVRRGRVGRPLFAAALDLNLDDTETLLARFGRWSPYGSPPT